MGLFDIFEDIGKAVLNVGSTVTHAVEDTVNTVAGVANAVTKPLTDAATSVGTEVYKAGEYGIKSGLKTRGGASIAKALGKGGGIPGGVAGALDHGKSMADHFQPSRPSHKPGHHKGGGSKPTKQHMEVLANGSSVPSKPEPKDNRPGCGGRRLQADGTCDKGPFNGGKSKTTPLVDVAKWKDDNKQILLDIVTFSLKSHPRTVDKAPELQEGNEASHKAYLKWAKAELKAYEEWNNKNAAQETEARNEEIINRKKKKIIAKINKRCDPKDSEGLADGEKTLDELTVLLANCDKAKRKKNFDESEIARKANVGKAKAATAKDKKSKEEEKVAKAAAVKLADEAGVKREVVGNTSTELLAEIAKNKKYPELSRRVYEYFNINNPDNARILKPFFGSVKDRQQRLELAADLDNTTPAEILKTWSGDYVAKMVNDYVKLYLKKNNTGPNRPYEYPLKKNPLPSPVQAGIRYTEKLRLLIKKARKLDKANLPVSYLAMKLKDNKFLNAPRVPIGSKTQVAVEDKKLEDMLDKDKAANKAILKAKKKEAALSNKEIAAAEAIKAAAAKATPEAVKAKEVETYATENQKANPNRNFIADALQKGDRNRYHLATEKDNRDYAIDSLLSHLAYKATQPPKVIGKWEFQSQDSTAETKVWLNRSGDTGNNATKIKMAFKGTDNVKEAISVDFFNIALGLGGPSKAVGLDRHYQRAILKYNELRKKYKLAEFSFTGHSLGGRTAIVVANYEQTLYGGDTVPVDKRLTGQYRKSHVSSFATGSGLGNFLTSLSNAVKKTTSTSEQTWKKPNIQLYRVENDPLSAADAGNSPGHKLYNIPQQSKCGAIGAHSTLNFIHKDFWTIKERKDCSRRSKGLGSGGTTTTTTTTTRSANPYSNSSTPKKNLRGADTGDYGKPDV